MATGLLKAGARVYISARKAEQLQSAQQSLSQWGEVHAVQCDLASVEGVSTLTETLIEHCRARITSYKKPKSFFLWRRRPRRWQLSESGLIQQETALEEHVPYQ